MKKVQIYNKVSKRFTGESHDSDSLKLRESLDDDFGVYYTDTDINSGVVINSGEIPELNRLTPPEDQDDDIEEYIRLQKIEDDIFAAALTEYHEQESRLVNLEQYKELTPEMIQEAEAQYVSLQRKENIKNL